MTGDDTRRAVKTAAKTFGLGNATIHEMSAALYGNLPDLCRDAPLTGDYFYLFGALES